MPAQQPLPPLESLKDQAKRLRASLGDAGNPISHAQALEALARQYGYRDWNTLHAAAGNRYNGPPVAIGQTVTGSYLGQPVIGEVIAVSAWQSGGRWRVTLQLDEPVDVVTFDSFSAYRSRINATIDAEGKTAEKTSNGRPHLRLDLG